jgi:2-amino-4-hydroxy-6-hydroxymethyldihydropteridine diphosphokinase
MPEVFIGIGSNLGDRRANIQKALGSLGRSPDINIKEISEIYETEPVGGPPQGKYLNAVSRLTTPLGPAELLKLLKEIEEAMGRSPAEKDNPRVIDLDILLYGDITLDGKSLKVPHPRMHLRKFVLRGMSQIAPDIRHPLNGKTMRRLYMEISDGERDEGNK